MKFRLLQKDSLIKLLIILVPILIFRNWLLPLFPNLATDISYDFKPLVEGFHFPYAWRNTLIGDGLGSYVVNTLWSYPIQILFQFFLKLNIPFWFQMKYFALLPSLIISYFGFKKLSRYFEFNYLLAWLIYIANTYFILLVDGGQLHLVLAYSFLPLLYFLYKRSVSKAGVISTDAILFGIGLAVMSAFDIRLLFPAFIIFAVDFLITLTKSSNSRYLLVKNNLSSMALGLVILLLLNTYWIIPGVFSKSIQLPEGHGNLQNVYSLSFTTITHSLFFQQPHWFLNTFGRITAPIWYFGLLPLMALIGYLLGPKGKGEKIFLGVLVMGIFLTKGANAPFPEIYTWLFKNFPGFSVFRDSTKFFVLVAIAYSSIFGLIAKRLQERFGKRYIYFVIFILFYVSFINYPVIFNKMTGTFTKPIHFSSVEKVNKIIKNDNNFSRSLWLPRKHPYGYVSYRHPSIDSQIIVQKRPFAIGTVGTYEQFNFLREAPFMGELFKVAGIEYIAYPFPDTRREELKQDNIDYYHAFLDQLTNLPWVEESLSEPPVPLLKTKESGRHFFTADNTFCVVGSDRIYWDLAGIEGFDLSRNALIFLEEQPGTASTVKDAPCTYVLYEKEVTDLAASLIDESNFVFPAEQFDFDPDETGIWKRETSDLIWWRDFLQTKYGIDNLDFDYGGGWAVAEGNKQLTINNKQKTINDKQGAGGNLLLARVMESSKGGKVEFFQDEEKIGEIDTKLEEVEDVEITLSGYEEVPDQVFSYDKADVRWFEVGELDSERQPLTIKTSGDINVVNAVAVVSEEEWQRINVLIHEYSTLDWENLTDEQKSGIFAQNLREEGDVAVDYKRISPTHYKVTVEGLNEPATLAFSETYDSLWKANGRASYPLYSLINGFQIEEDGEYDIVFSAQRYVLPGLYISGATLVVIFGLLIYSIGRKANDPM